MPKPNRKVIISCAVTGAIHTPSMSPHLPVTPAEIIQQSLDAAAAGATILHLHARDPQTGRPTQDPNAFRAFLPQLKQATGAVLNLTTGGSPHMTVEERMRPAAELKPEVASLNMGSMNFGLYLMLDRFTQFQHAWEREHLENSRDLVFKNTFADIEHILKIGNAKSFFAIDFGFHVAAGEPWQGRLVKQGRVLLLAAEGAAGIPNRLKAIKLANPEFSSRAESNFSYITGQFDLRSDTHREEICALVRDQPPALLIIDTVAMTFGDAVENEAHAMALYVKQITALGAAFKCSIMLIHHPGKDSTRGLRGSSVLRAAVDTEVLITSDEKRGVRTAKITKQREGETGLHVAFVLRTVQLGSDPDGDPITSCVVMPTSGEPSECRAEPTGNSKAALQALQDAMRQAGCTVPDAPASLAGRHGVTTLTWLGVFLDQQKDKNLKEDSKLRSFRRGEQWLKTNGYIKTLEEFVFLIHTDEGKGKPQDISPQFATQ